MREVCFLISKAGAILWADASNSPAERCAPRATLVPQGTTRTSRHKGRSSESGTSADVTVTGLLISTVFGLLGIILPKECQ